MELKGKVTNVLPLENGISKTGNKWQKATIIVEYGDGQYTKTVAVSNMKSAEEFSKIPVGTDVTLQVDVTSREFNGRWYTSCDCWRWETEKQQSTYDPYAAMMPPKQEMQSNPLEQDTLPFPF